MSMVMPVVQLVVLGYAFGRNEQRGVFKTTVSRQKTGALTPEAMAEIDFNFEGLRPYLKA